MRALLFLLIAWPAIAQVFTEDGRRYVKGSKDKRCNFAYLENPRIGAANGRPVGVNGARALRWNR